MQILLNRNDITNFVVEHTWSGSYQNAVRKIELSILVSSDDPFLPKIDVEIIDFVQFFYGNIEVFQGFTTAKEKSYDGMLKVVVTDASLYLKQNDYYGSFTNTTAEHITKVVCEKLGVEVGFLAQTNITQNLVSLSDSAYDVIMKAYTCASMATGKKYMPIMKNGKLNVIEKGSLIVEKILQNDDSLIDSTYSETIEDMINKVTIIDNLKENAEDNNTYTLIDTVTNDEDMNKYGSFEKVYKVEEGKNAKVIAEHMLHGLTRKGNISALGNINCVAGSMVAIKDEYTGLVGAFYIEADTHKFKNGMYTMDLELNFENVMDEKDFENKVSEGSDNIQWKDEWVNTENKVSEGSDNIQWKDEWVNTENPNW